MSYKIQSPPDKRAVALAFRGLAGWPQARARSAACRDAAPLLFVKACFDEPLESVARRLVSQHGRDIVVVQVPVRTCRR